MIENYVKECLSCPNPLCEKGCPVGNKIRDFIKALKEDDLNKAGEILYGENPFPAITSRVCAYEKQCEGHCVKHFKGQAVVVHEIEKYISDRIKDKYTVKAYNGRKIAIVGAGISALALSKLLAIDGYSIDIYEKEDFIGGAIATGIPEFRFKHEYLNDIYEELLNLGINFKFHRELGRDIDIHDLMNYYDRVVIATGASLENNLRIEGEDLAVSGLNLLYDLNILNKQKEYACKSAMVVGGGNVAIDVARSLKRFIPEVTIVYRRSEKEMPANLSEIELCKKEDINFSFQTSPVKIEAREDGYDVTLIKMELGDKDESGRASFKAIANSEYHAHSDLIVACIGQKFKKIYSDMEVYKYETSYPNVYIVGDANIGASTVSHCIGDAKKLKTIIDSSF